MTCDVDLLTRYCEQFVGYGSLEGRLWFVGLEEGGGRNLQLVKQRLAIWQGLGEPSTMDVEAFHEALGDGDHLFNQRAPLQRTWNKLIEAHFAARGQRSHREDRRQFQIEKLGRARADHCLLELMPLPSPHLGAWIYEACVEQVAWLESRRTYLARWRSQREKLIKRLVRQYRPRAVVMYGASYLQSWRAISNNQLGAHSVPGIYHGEHLGTGFFALPHPRLSTLSQWHGVGEAIRATSRRVRGTRNLREAHPWPI